MVQWRLMVLGVMLWCGSLWGAQAFDRHEERDLAMLKGLSWVSAYLVDEDHFRDVDFDCFHIFNEIHRTAHNPLIGQWCESVAFMYGQRLKEYTTLFRDPLRGYHCLQMLSLSCSSFDRIDFEPMYKKAKASFETYKTDQQIYWIEVDNLEELSEKNLFNLLIRTYELERINLAYDNEYHADFRLLDMLRYLKAKPLVAIEDDSSLYKNTWRDHCYLATHIVLALNNYNEFQLQESDAPWVFDYIRASYPAAFARNDVELVGEFVDSLRALGLTEDNDEMVRQGTEFLLDSQNVDGSWSAVLPSTGNGSWRPYHIMHPTWCALVGLRPRVYLEDTPYQNRIREILNELNGEQSTN